MHAQYTKPPGSAAARVGAAVGLSTDFGAGAALGDPFVAGAVLGELGVQILWQAQYTEPPGSAVACVGAAGPCVAQYRFRGRRSAG